MPLKWCSAEGDFEIYVADLASGAHRRLIYDPASDYAPRWSRDGKTIYFTSIRTGKNQLWRIGAAGGEAVQVTRGGGFVGEGASWHVRGLTFFVR